MEQTRWIVLDGQGIITDTPDEDEALASFETEGDFAGDLVLARVEAVRR